MTRSYRGGKVRETETEREIEIENAIDIIQLITANKRWDAVSVLLR